MRDYEIEIDLLERLIRTTPSENEDFLFNSRDSQVLSYVRGSTTTVKEPPPRQSIYMIDQDVESLGYDDDF